MLRTSFRAQIYQYHSRLLDRKTTVLKKTHLLRQRFTTNFTKCDWNLSVCMEFKESIRCLLARRYSYAYKRLNRDSISRKRRQPLIQIAQTTIHLDMCVIQALGGIMNDKKTKIVIKKIKMPHITSLQQLQHQTAQFSKSILRFICPVACLLCSARDYSNSD